MDLKKHFSGFLTVGVYLASTNEKIRGRIEAAANSVMKAAQQSIQTIDRHRELISDAADHLNGEFVAELEYSQADELKVIGKIESELVQHYNQTIWQAQFEEFSRELEDKANELKALEKELDDKEKSIEETVKARVAEASARLREEETSSRHLFESALKKAENIVDQNKITRFAYSTISRFQEEFGNIMGSSDVELITKLFQDTIEPFQTTKIVTDKDGNKVKITTNTFSDNCYQDLFFFFYKYYSELMEIQTEEGRVPSTAEELARIFQKKKTDAADIVKSLHEKHKAKQDVISLEI